MATTTKILGVIPARYGSTRFPGKILAPVCGRPLIAWVLDRVSQATCLSTVMVATDDERIRDAVRGLGAEVMMTDPSHPSGTDRAAEVAACLFCDVVINIQGDEPMIDPGLIDRIGETLMTESAWDMATAATPLTNPDDLASPSVVKVVCDADGGALYFSRSPIPHDRDGILTPGGKPGHWRHVGLYGYRVDFLQRLVESPPCRLEEIEKLEQLRALYIGCRMKVLRAEEAGPGIDAPEDLPRVEAALRAAGLA